MKKDNRIDLKDRSGIKFQLFIIFILIFFFYLVFYKFQKYTFIKTGLCESCHGILGILNNPLPGFIYAFSVGIAFLAFSKIFKSDWYDYREKGKIVGELQYDDGSNYFGQIKKINKDEFVAHGKGYLTTKDNKIIKGKWKNGLNITKKDYPKLIRKNIQNNNFIFEFNGGDLWVRDNVSFWDDQDTCWNDKILKAINSANIISSFIWKINYTFPFADQIKNLKDNQKYKIISDNYYHANIIKYSDGILNITDDVLLFDPEIICQFINKLSGIKKIIVGINIMEPNNFDTEEDEWIKNGLKNNNWNINYFDPYMDDDLKDVKYIKDNIDKDIVFEFDLPPNQMKILKKEKII